MSKDLTPSENKIKKIDEAGYNLIMALAKRRDTKDIDVTSMLACLDEACNDEKIRLMINRIKLNNSKLVDITKANANASVLDSNTYKELYGRNMTFDRRELKKIELIEENLKCKEILAGMNVSERNESKKKDYLDIKVERENENGRVYLESPYQDFRRYTNEQITSDILARTIYKLVMNNDKSLEAFKNNDVIQESVERVIGAMSIDDLGTLIDQAEEDVNNGNDDKWIFEVIDNVATLNENNEVLITPMPQKLFEEILQETDKSIEKEEREKEELKQLNTLDEFGFEEVDDYEEEDETDDISY